MRALLLQVPEMDAVSQMAMDEAQLDAAEPSTLYLRIYRWKGRPPYGVTFGYSQSHAEIMEAVRSRGLPAEAPVVRRCTGGGIVYHDGDITFSFVFPWGERMPPRVIYRDIHYGVHLGLKSFQVRSRMWSASPAAGDGGTKTAVRPRLQCFSGPEPEDLVRGDGSKFLGGALRRRRGTGLYQGSMRPEGLGASPERLRQALLEGFSLKWSALFEPAEPGAGTAAAAEELRGRRYSTDEWNKRR